ncbi:MAG: ATP phosphoribosyltransferase regulatory subunit [Pseudomonadota bacterium]
MRETVWNILSEGAEIVSPAALQPADVLLDLYGEDIRARAYTTYDPVLGEMMLRPDFTVPVVQMHMARGVEPGRYAYRGAVWRKQTAQSARPREYDQIGLEIFDGSDPALAEADVYARVYNALDAVLAVEKLSFVAGDVGLMRAAVGSLATSELRRTALLRHLWRPARFNALLARFAGEAMQPEGRDQLPVANKREAITSAGPIVGLRSVENVEMRIQRLLDDKTQPKVPREQITALRSLQALKVPLEDAPDALTPLSEPLHLVSSAIQKLRTTLGALSDAGVDTSRIQFEGRYGLTAMEYYDGFVFGIAHGERLLATGGRYDALTAVLGGGAEMAAVGAVIRPGEVSEIGDG